MPALTVPVQSLLAGRVAPFARGESSAIAKRALTGRIQIGRLGIEGDEQADLRHHGGPDKALHHYPFEHYARWRDLLPDHELLNSPGSFGENVSTLGLVEDAVCIGDRFRLGTALIEISQGRQPCWKQGERLGSPSLPALMVTERRSGWYCRVIEPGFASACDMLSLVERTQPDWSVARVFGLLIAGDHKKDGTALADLARLEPLFSGWRERALSLMSD